jgi:hypothetical protein
MSFGNAMAIAAVEWAKPSAGLSPTQVKAALVSKYGTTAGDAISTQFGQVLSDSVERDIACRFQEMSVPPARVEHRS